MKPDSDLAPEAADQRTPSAHEHLRETRDAVSRMPQAVRGAAWRLADAILERTLWAQSSTEYGEAVRLHSAKVAAFSMLNYLSLCPWHALHDAEVARVATLMASDSAESVVAEYFESLEPSNVFLQAHDDETMPAYMQRLREVISGRRVGHVLLDEALFRPSDDESRLRAAAGLGMAGFFVGISSLESAPRHSCMRVNSYIVAADAPIAAPARAPAAPAPASITERLDAAKRRRTQIPKVSPSPSGNRASA